MQYRPEIDGLRALAVIPVILFHAGFEIFSGGFVGVDIFFVISGYLITSIIVAELNAGQFSLVNFYERRARRILPALFFVMLACLPFAWYWLIPEDMKAFSKSLAAVSLFASNILFWKTSGYFDTATELKPLLHTWSLAVEEQYYLFFPLLLMLLWRFQRFWIVSALSFLFLVSLFLAQWGATAAPSAAFYLLPTRGWELLVGAFIALYFSKQHDALSTQFWHQLGSVCGAVLIFYAVFVFDEKTPFPSFYTLIPVIGTALIVLSANKNTFVGKLLGSRVLVGIGLISYSAYLWHQPLFAFTRYKIFDEPSKWLMTAMVALSIALAYVTWRYVETPFRNKQGFSRKSIFTFSLAGSLFFILIGGVGSVTQGFKDRGMAQKFTALEYDTKKLGYKLCDSPALINGDPLNYCFVTNQGPVNAVIIGDSHADDKFYGIEKNDSSKNWALIGNSSCPPVLDVSVEGDQKGCERKFKKIIAWLISNEQIDTVLLSYYGNYALDTSYAADHIAKKVGPDNITISSNEIKDLQRAELFYYGLSRSVAELSKTNKSIYIAVDIPELPFFPVDCLRGRPDCQISLSQLQGRQAVHRKSLDDLKAQFPNVHIFDPTNIFCSAKSCSYIRNETVLYRDSHHLTLAGSDLYGEVFSRWRLEQVKLQREFPTRP
jgi:peptidoglycan/LPS O-acetylase OafA/YrhL